MAEYFIQIKKGNEVTHVVTMAADRKTPTLAVATTEGFKYASKFKVKDRALKVASKIQGAEVVPSFGGFVNSTKSSVAPIQSKVNGHSAYKTI